MSPFLESLIVAGLVGSADGYSTHLALQRVEAQRNVVVQTSEGTRIWIGGGEKNWAGKVGGPLLLGVAVGAGDILAQQVGRDTKKPWVKWVYRGAVVVGVGLVVIKPSHEKVKR